MAGNKTDVPWHQIYLRLINEEESETGVPSRKARDIDGNQVLATDETARALYIQRQSCTSTKYVYAEFHCTDLQELRHLTKATLESMYQSTDHLPYIVRLSAREALLALRVSPQS